MDEAAFRDLYERTASQLRAYVYLAVKDAALADDLLQEAYCRLLRARLRDANLWLAYVEGASHREIASSLGMAEGSVRVVLYRARKRLAGMLQDHGWGPGEVR